MELHTTARRIKSLEIQGAENVAIAAVRAIKAFSREIKTGSKAVFLSRLSSAAQMLMESRPTEPCMQNALRRIIKQARKGKTAANAKKEAQVAADAALLHFKTAEAKIACLGEKLIRNKYIVFTHCHSSTVTGVLKEAKRRGRRFEVYNTETRPRLQGRLTSKELAKAGIPVTHFVDADAGTAIQKADIVLLGADAIEPDGSAINKIGSRMFAELAHRWKKPVYICADSWKLSAKKVVIETRPGKEVWAAPKGVHVENTAFVKIPPALVDLVISERGAYAPKRFVKLAKQLFRQA